MEYIEDLKGIKGHSLKSFIEDALYGFKDADKILVIFPDYTRVDFTHIIAPHIINRFRGSHIDFLNAGGTHRSMPEDEFRDKLGIKVKGPEVRFLNHRFSDPLNLINVGTIDKGLVSKKTRGQLDTDIDITVNKLIFSDYDLILAISGTVPHEAAGYSGGLKIFFPGISGPHVIDLFHWAAVLVGIHDIIGTVDNNARDIINTGAKTIFDEIDPPVYSINMVNTEEEGRIKPVGLYIDSDFKGFLSAYRKAAEASSKVHVKYIDEPLSSVVQVIPENYDEIWLAGKGSYKLQKPGVLVKGAEVIIYAPHIRHFHTNPDIERDLFSLGYHCRDHVCSLIEKGAELSKNAAAHLINVCGPGIFEPRTGKEDLHFKVTLATAIPEEECRKIGLSYRDPATVKREDFSGPGRLWIKEGGKYLYDLKRKEKL
ncbi:MAG: lactate racemase domain-containing protein [Candidatus Humimicrobiaceae bacterium]